jgi:hypothetical protein
MSSKDILGLEVGIRHFLQYFISLQPVSPLFLFGIFTFTYLSDPNVYTCISDVLLCTSNAVFREMIDIGRANR